MTPNILQHWERGMQNGLVNLSNPLLVSTFSLLGHADDTLCNSMMPSRSITGKKSNFYCCTTNLSIVFAKLSPDVFWYFLCQDYLSADSEAHDTPDLSVLPQGLAHWKRQVVWSTLTKNSLQCTRPDFFSIHCPMVEYMQMVSEKLFSSVLYRTKYLFTAPSDQADPQKRIAHWLEQASSCRGGGGGRGGWHWKNWQGCGVLHPAQLITHDAPSLTQPLFIQLTLTPFHKGMTPTWQKPKYTPTIYLS